MMKTSTKSTSISAMFLSTVLIAGTIAALFPSFMIGAQADPYYGMDKDNKKVDKKISVSSLKCNNINVNVNGLTLDVFPPFLGGGDLAAEAADGETDANSFANNGVSDGGSTINDFRFICINNNNNTVSVEQPPEPPTCEECFSESGLNDLQIQRMLGLLEQSSLGELCETLQLVGNSPAETTLLGDALVAVGATETQIGNILDCLADLGLILFPIPP